MNKKRNIAVADSGLPRFPGSIFTLSVLSPTMPTFSTLALRGTSACSSTLKSPWATGAILFSLYRELEVSRGLHSGWWTLSKDWWMQKYQSLAPLLQTGIVVRCHLDSRVPLRDLPSERLLPEITPVLAFFPFSNLFPTLLPVFLEAFLETICKWMLISGTASAELP